MVAALALLVAAAGCPGARGDAAEDSLGGTDGDSPSGDPRSQCLVDADCEPAGATCCDCPSFSLPVTDGHGRACNSVDCEPGATCSTLAEAACVDGGCELRCAAVRLGPGESCAQGFVRDELGCLTSTCFSPEPGEPVCADDGECVQVPADCCGCERGGRDTAVRAEDVDAHMAGLGCSGTPTCPGVNVCDADVIPRCFGGQCQLVSNEPPDGDAAPDTLCGTDAFAPCPAGQVCVLNDPDADLASDYGVGVCRPE